MIAVYPLVGKVSLGATGRSFYGRKISVKDYSDDDPAWTPGSASRSRGGGGKPPGSKRGRKAKEAEVYVISSSTEEDDEEEVRGDNSLCVVDCSALLL